jgi:hypothetical protein
MALALVTVVFATGTMFVFGLVHMGDCYPEEPIYSQCLTGMARTGRVVLGIAVVTYACAVWLIVRRRKEI